MAAPDSADAAKNTGSLVGLDPDVRQRGNVRWWTENTMSYDWKSKSAIEPWSDAWFSDIDARCLHDHRLFAEAANPYVEMMGLNELKDKRVLEIGCGMGMHSQMLLEAGASVTSIDISPTSVDATRRRLSLRHLTGDVRLMDAERLDLSPESFDMVWSWGVIHHSARTSHALREIARVLKPGGQARIMVYSLDGMSAYMTMVRRYALGFWLGRSLDEQLWRDTDGFTARYYTKDNWMDLLSLFFESTETRLCGQDADVVPLPRQLRKPLLKLMSLSWKRQLAARRGSMIFSISRKAGGRS